MCVHEFDAPGIDLVDIRGYVGVEEEGCVHGPGPEIQEFLLAQLAGLPKQSQDSHNIIVDLTSSRMEGFSRSPRSARGTVNQVSDSCKDQQQKYGLENVKEQEHARSSFLISPLVYHKFKSDEMIESGWSLAKRFEAI